MLCQGPNYTGVFSISEQGTLQGASGGPWFSGNFNLDLSHASSIYGNSDTVQPASLICRYYIKF